MKAGLPLQIRHTIRRYRMFQPGDRVGVAVSGGADSVALLLLLNNLRDDLGITLSVLHLNHCLRGAEADRDEAFVAALAKQIGMEFISERVDVAAAARAHKLNLEDAGRRVRYAFFNRLIAERCLARVAVAHTLEDQAETVLGRMLRGAGTRGLAGIFPVRGSIVRPLIECHRQSVRDYLTAIGQLWCEDSTNLDMSRMRARLRHELIPAIEKSVAPQVTNRLVQLARTFHDEEAFWSWFVDNRIDKLVTIAESGLSIAVSDILRPLPTLEPASGRAVEHPDAASLAVCRRMIQRIFERLVDEESRLSFQHVENVMSLATKSRSGHQINLPKGICVERAFDRLTFSSRRCRQLGEQCGRVGVQVSPYSYALTVPDFDTIEVKIAPLKTLLTLKLIDWPETQRETRDGLYILDADLLRSPLALRNWQPGDAYRPEGHRSRHKVKELFLRDRVPVRQRAYWPVLSSGIELAWAKNMPVAAEFAACGRTKRALYIWERIL